RTTGASTTPGALPRCGLVRTEDQDASPSTGRGSSAHVTTATARRDPPSPLIIGAVVWISSELLFFGSLFGSYFTLRARADGPWPPEGADVEVWAGAIGTVLLLVSSVTVHSAVTAARAGHTDTMRRWLLATIAL